MIRIFLIRSIIICIFIEVCFIHASIANFLHLRAQIQIILVILILFCIVYSLKITKPRPMGIYLILLFLYLIILNIFYLDEKFLFYLLRGPAVSLILYTSILFALCLSSPSQQSVFFDQICKIFVYSVLFSSIVAIGQSANIDIFWNLRDFSIVEVSSNDAVGLSIIERHRPVGLAVNSVELGYQSVLAVALLSPKRRLSSFIFFVIILGGQIAVANRSALLTIFIYLFIFKKDIKLYLRLFILLCLIAIIFIFGSQRLYSIDASALGKLYLVYFGFLYFLDNPFGSGITLQDFLVFRDSYSMYGISSNENVVSELQRYTPHNQIINTLVIYGVFGSIVFGLAIWHLFIKKIHLNHLRSEKLSALRIGFFLYFLNSMVHNAGFFVMDPLIWYFLPFYDKFLEETSNNFRSKT
jgi:hypothetical protein